MSYASTTRTTLRSRIRERLLSTFWTDTELNLYINEAMRMWNVCVGFYFTQSFGTTGISGLRTFLDLTGEDTNYLCALRIDNNSTSEHLTQTTLADLDGLNPYWQTQALFNPVKYWAPVGLNYIAISPPAPNGPTHTVWSARYAPIPTADGDFIQVGDEDLGAIVDYACFVATLKEGGAEAQTAIKFFANFLKQAASYNDKLKRTEIYRRYVGGVQTRLPAPPQ